LSANHHDIYAPTTSMHDHITLTTNAVSARQSVTKLWLQPISRWTKLVPRSDEDCLRPSVNDQQQWNWSTLKQFRTGPSHSAVNLVPVRRLTQPAAVEHHRQCHTVNNWSSDARHYILLELMLFALAGHTVQMLRKEGSNLQQVLFYRIVRRIANSI